jgi:predicted transposase YbfD/YdcC
MDANATALFLRLFGGLPDPRRHNVRHLFTDILTLAVLGILCRADDWTDVVAWATANLPWLKTFLALPHGIPCADTFGRVFARINPAAFEACFIRWSQDLAAATDGRLVAIDGKSLRRSFEHGWDKSSMTHVISAWCGQNQMVLGQLAVEGKSNEITAIPALLELLDLKGAIVTIDAMGCQRQIAQKILDRKADYVLALKDNQGALYDKTRKLLDEAVLERFAGMSHDACETTNAGHGRIETRRVWVTDEVKWLGEELLSLWPELSSVARVDSVRILNDKTVTHARYFISSLKGCDAPRMGQKVRGHWGIENGLHWRMDTCFGEDQSRIRVGFGAQNFSRLRRIVINQLRNAPDKHSLKTRRYLCSIDRQYLLDRLKQ